MLEYPTLETICYFLCDVIMVTEKLDIKINIKQVNNSKLL